MKPFLILLVFVLMIGCSPKSKWDCGKQSVKLQHQDGIYECYDNMGNIIGFDGENYFFNVQAGDSVWGKYQ